MPSVNHDPIQPMLLHIPDVLDSSQVSRFRELLDTAEFADGRATAGYQSAKVKRNGQLAEGHPIAVQLGAEINEVLSRNSLFFSAALPRHVFPPLFNRYQCGDGFGLHIDNAIRYERRSRPAQPIRTDLSATLFLSSPDEYDGGELTIEDSYGSHQVKLPAGDMLLYPASSLHKVEKISRGERLASFFWIQSMVRSDAHRRTLFELDGAIQKLTSRVPDADELLALTGVYHNLLRDWADV